jgi:hypothetical protein
MYSLTFKATILEWISNTEVKRHILPPEVVNPSLTLWETWIVELEAEVDTKNNKRSIDT